MKSSSIYPLYLILYNNDRVKMKPEQLKEFLTQERFRYIICKSNLRKWDYRINMIFDNRYDQKVAINEVKKLKNDYDLSYHYDFKKNPRLNDFLPSLREYDKLLELSRQTREKPDVRPEPDDKKKLQRILDNTALMEQLLQYELKLLNR